MRSTESGRGTGGDPPGTAAAHGPRARASRTASGDGPGSGVPVDRRAGGAAPAPRRRVTHDPERLALVNVMQQLDHLRAHACVARRVAEGSLT
ncbi:carbonic anhydrase, partial [Streptomyces celluloflavus]